MKKLIATLTALATTAVVATVATPAAAGTGTQGDHGVSLVVEVRELAGSPYLYRKVTNYGADQAWVQERQPTLGAAKVLNRGKSLVTATKLRDDSELSGQVVYTIRVFEDGRFVNDTITVEYNAAG